MLTCMCNITSPVFIRKVLFCKSVFNDSSVSMYGSLKNIFIHSHLNLYVRVSFSFSNGTMIQDMELGYGTYIFFCRFSCL